MRWPGHSAGGWWKKQGFLLSDDNALATCAMSRLLDWEQQVATVAEEAKRMKVSHDAGPQAENKTEQQQTALAQEVVAEINEEELITACNNSGYKGVNRENDRAAASAVQMAEQPQRGHKRHRSGDMGATSNPRFSGAPCKVCWLHDCRCSPRSSTQGMSSSAPESTCTTAALAATPAQSSNTANVPKKRQRLFGKTLPNFSGR